ncbi:MAG: UDP-N-acetylmuramate:L-alanyl-gamma-D-glutamyl-meso-diaminopimelate ligase [Gammaproteobacteria bacterium]|nr:UDP-N-acetylmuramate:L-alanyl-gamma-D-glutamyl-meso-diaminopimelate ligase [Gammaproteobacteria bacterium]
MHVHILGICGTFMGGVAALAKAMGHHVTGSDANVYPPMSTQLESLGIELIEGWDPSQLDPEPDVVVIGNALSRGNACVEAVLNRNLPFTSGAQWLAENVIHDCWRLAVAGTHGKTTTASMLAWVLEYAGMSPGFLIGGIPADFGISARLGDSPFFVIEADEYDTAFFDKRSKFVHYGPRTLVLNNLEFDHADIFEDLDAIKKQFHHLVRTVPGEGLIVMNGNDAALDDVIERGCWTPRETFGEANHGNWNAHALDKSASRFEVSLDRETIGTVEWSLTGRHNMLNALAVIAAARHAGVPAKEGIAALNAFKGVKRRMELRGEPRGIKVFDDFAHHPTAIHTTLEGLQGNAGGRVIAVLEPRSNSMRMGVHREQLAGSLALADRVYLYQPPFVDWSLQSVVEDIGPHAAVSDSIDGLVDTLAQECRSGDTVVIMSNGGFGGIHQKLLDRLEQG